MEQKHGYPDFILDLLDTKLAIEAERARVDRELREIEGEIGATRPRLLDSVRVATPCHARWDEMHGDERRRFCPPCGKEVFNLSAMTRSEAEDFLASRLGRLACIRLYRRSDGTVITSDCTTVRSRRRRFALVAAGVTVLAYCALDPKGTVTDERAAYQGVRAPEGPQLAATPELQAVYK